MMLPGKTFILMSAAAAVLALAASDRSIETTVKDAPQKAVLARLDEIQQAAQALQPDKVFSFVLENDNGALVQNGRLLMTKKDALEATRQGFQGLQSVSYTFDQQRVTLLSPTLALVVGEGSSEAVLQSGRDTSTRFAQSVFLVLTNGEWKVFHSHRSFPPR